MKITPFKFMFSSYVLPTLRTTINSAVFIATLGAPALALTQNSSPITDPVLDANNVVAKPVAVKRPFAEYEKVKYVILSAGFDFQTQELKKKILTKLPKDIIALVYSTSESDLELFEKNLLSWDFNTYAPKEGAATSGWRKPSEYARIQTLHIKAHGESFWPRDSWPYPVYLENGELSLVDTPYYELFEPDELAGRLFSLPLNRHDKFFEHGNLIANRLGHCMTVSETLSDRMPDSLFREYYGCKQITRLPFVAGIGHADEIVKFMADDVVLTNLPQLIPMLEGFGYKVHLLPKAVLPAKLAARGVMDQRNYLNSLLVNNVVFVPVFGAAEDEKALEIYRSLKLEVVPIDASYVSDYGGGALHCLSMTYPQLPAIYSLKNAKLESQW